MKTPYQISQRVDNYIKFRPRYPQALLQLLRTNCRLAPQHTVADIGCGPGILAALFLPNGNPVIGVEPDPEMRAGAAVYLAGWPNFTTVAATAEETTLPENSIDFVTVGQAFHWFNIERTKQELTRILAPGGWVVLVWNIQQSVGTPFLEDLQQFWANPAYRKAETRNASREMARAQNLRLNPDLVQQELVEPFFAGGTFTQAYFENPLECNFEALKGRILSNRSIPEPGHPKYGEMVAQIQDIFAQHKVNGTVTIEHKTHVVYGQLPI